MENLAGIPIIGNLGTVVRIFVQCINVDPFLTTQQMRGLYMKCRLRLWSKGMVFDGHVCAKLSHNYLHCLTAAIHICTTIFSGGITVTVLRK